MLDELRDLARRYLAGERPGHTLQPTALVHEVYLRLVGGEVQRFARRSEFFAFAARLMREILVDHARAKQTAKRGRAAAKLPLEAALGVAAGEGLDWETVLAVDEAVNRLGRLHPRQKQVVELRYFVGLTVPEIARALELGRATVERDWAVARRWLARELGRGPHPTAEGTPDLEDTES